MARSIGLIADCDSVFRPCRGKIAYRDRSAHRWNSRWGHTVERRGPGADCDRTDRGSACALANRDIPGQRRIRGIAERDGRLAIRDRQVSDPDRALAGDCVISTDADSV